MFGLCMFYKNRHWKYSNVDDTSKAELSLEEDNVGGMIICEWI